MPYDCTTDLVKTSNSKLKVLVDIHRRCGSKKMTDILGQYQHVLAIADDGMNWKRVNQAYRSFLKKFLCLCDDIDAAGLLDRDENNATAVDVHACIKDVHQKIYYLRNAHLAMLRYNNCEETGANVFASDEAWKCSTQALDDSKDMRDGTQLILYLLHVLKLQDLGIYRGEIYSKRETEDGYFTYSWTRESSMKEFVYKNVQKEINFKLYNTLFQMNFDKIASFLNESADHEVTKIDRDRTAFAFSNGLFLAETLEFYTYDKGNEILETTFGKSGKFAAKYFDYPFDPDWLTMPLDKIPTTTTDFILNHQQLDKEDGVIPWYWILKGRLIFNNGTHDNWQVVLQIVGVTGTGKSTDCYQTREMYENDDIASLPNYMQAGFGTNLLWDDFNKRLKFLWVNSEMKDNWNIDQATYQSMVDGVDPMVITMKHNNSFSIPKCTTPGCCWGNMRSDFEDNGGGSMSRRSARITFKHAVKETVDNLKPLLLKEMPAYICRAARSYMEEVKKSPEIGFWNRLPQYFVEQRELAALESNPLEAFLASDLLDIASPAEKDDGFSRPTLYIPERDFKVKFKTFCDQNELKFPKWSEDNLNGPFSKKGLSVRKKANWPYPRVHGQPIDNARPIRKHGTFILNCDVV